MPHLITEAKSAIEHLKHFQHVIELREHPTGQGGTSDVWKGKLQHSEDVVSRFSYDLVRQVSMCIQ